MAVSPACASKLFPALESVNLGMSKKVHAHHDLTDWSVEALPNLRSFTWHWCWELRTSQVLNLLRVGVGVVPNFSTIESSDNSKIKQWEQTNHQ